jgi:hypothetical protein
MRLFESRIMDSYYLLAAFGRNIGGKVDSGAWMSGGSAEEGKNATL